jgi:hypothetical protein
VTTGTDWRFLLPARTWPQLVLLGGVPGTAESLQEAGAATQVRETLEGPKADAVAILHGARVSPAEAVRRLAPGGWLYWEPDERPTLRTAFPALRRVTRKLRACGLEVAGVWWVWPGFDRPHVYVPPEALGWFARTIFPTRTSEERARGRALGLLARLGGASGALVTPCFAVVAGPATDSSRPVLLTHGDERVILLPFPPDRLLKVPRRPAFNGKTLREQETLTRVRSLVDVDIGRAIPEPGGTISFGQAVASVESYAPGRSMILTRGGEHDLRLAADWLTKFHLQTLVRRESWNGRDVAEAFAAWSGRSEAGPEQSALMGLAMARSRELHGVRFPVVWQHRDFTPWNLLLDDADRLRVLDWEGARPGPALCDLLHFAGHWDELEARAVTPQERIRAFLEGSSASRREIARYCERLGIDRRFVPLLLVYTRVEIALRTPVSTLDARYVAALGDHAEELFRAEGVRHVS